MSLTYEGRPCKHDGTTTKYTSSMGCVKCSKERGALKLRNALLMAPYRTKELLARRHRKHRLKKLYGMTPEEYDALLKAQKHRCAICRRKCPSKRRLAVDHDHKTKRVRGLLCLNCNQGIGKFHDDVTLLQAAAEYLNG